MPTLILHDLTLYDSLYLNLSYLTSASPTFYCFIILFLILPHLTIPYLNLPYYALPHPI